MLAAINEVQNGKKITNMANVSNVMKPPAAACKSLSFGMLFTQEMILSIKFFMFLNLVDTVGFEPVSLLAKEMCYPYTSGPWCL